MVCVMIKGKRTSNSQ